MCIYIIISYLFAYNNTNLHGQRNIFWPDLYYELIAGTHQVAMQNFILLQLQVYSTCFLNNHDAYGVSLSHKQQLPLSWLNIYCVLKLESGSISLFYYRLNFIHFSPFGHSCSNHMHSISNTQLPWFSLYLSDQLIKMLAIHKNHIDQ